MIAWKNMDTLASYEKLGKVQQVNLAEAMGGANGAECDPALVGSVSDILAHMPQISQLLPSISFGGSEDITTLMRTVQAKGGLATELLLGMPLIAPHHSSRFDIDEKVICLGAEIITALGLSLGQSPKL